MGFIEEQTMWASVVGLPLNNERLEKIAVYTGKGSGNYADCSAYLIENLAELDSVLLCRFQITSALVSWWNTAGVSFQLRLYTRNGRLIGGCIDKYRHTLEAGYPMAPSQQEIRVCGRMIRYLSAAEI